MISKFEKPKGLLRDFKGDRYLHGTGVLGKTGNFITGYGRSVLLIADQFPGSDIYIETIRASLQDSGIHLQGVIDGSRPNAPLEDLARIKGAFGEYAPEMVISFGGGSTIDATKAAIVLTSLGGEIEEYFGTGLVTATLDKSGKKLITHCAIQTAASSAAHLTKYSNITNLASGQKKLIVDEAIVPSLSIFDYETTHGAPSRLTIDGALDGVAHSVEVLYQLADKPENERIYDIARECVSLVVEYLPRAFKDPVDLEAREALGLATDLGGYAIMIGGTNGPHLTSFSLVDIMSHGHATGMLLPYYTVFFAPAIQGPLKMLAEVFTQAGIASKEITMLSGRELALEVARSMIRFSSDIGFQTTLLQVEGYSRVYMERALEAAKNPQLKMKLENMPVPLDAGQVERYLRPVLMAAETGNLEIIENAW